MRGKIFLASVIALLGFSFFLPSVALSADKVGITVTPRIWFTTADFNVTSLSEDTYESVFVPLYGGTISYKPNSSPVEYMVTILTGSGDALYSFDPPTTPAPGEFDNERLDLELLVRYPLKGTNVSLFGGFRYVSYEQDISLPGDTFSATGTSNFLSDTNVYLFEVGVGLFSNITEDGKHRLFANFTGGIGAINIELKNPAPGVVSDVDDTTLSVDANLGYSYVFNQSASAHFRYRFLTLTVPPDESLPAGIDVADNWVVFHGPEIGFTWRF